MASGERIRTISLNIDNSEVPFLAHRTSNYIEYHLAKLYLAIDLYKFKRTKFELFI